MITIKLLGGAKKSFLTDTITLKQNDLTIQKLIEHLIETKPENTPKLDVENMLIAVNGVDSSAIKGNLTKLKPDDVVSIIPIVHGGSHRRIQFRISTSLVELIQVKNDLKLGTEYLDILRKKFPNIAIQGITSHNVMGKTHAKKIINISLHAKKNNILLSKKLETDLLMRFACTTQINQAIQQVGIKKGKSFIIIAIGKKNILENLYHELKPFMISHPFSINNQNFLKKKFKISKKQFDAIKSKQPLEDLCAEKAAILI